MHMPHATSLRMGRLGYQSDAQTSLSVSYNSLDSYAASLSDALVRPYPAYEALGIRAADGGYNQLNDSLLQIENEFYGTIRPKRVIFPGERPLHALRERGVEYIEVRCMDLDPFVPAGIAPATMRMIDIFLLHCLLDESPLDSPNEIAELGRNQQRVAARGREPGLKLERGGVEVLMTDWLREILTECGPIAAWLDAHEGTDAHSQALAAARAAVLAPDTLPSARVLAEMQRQHAGSHDAFVRAHSQRTRDAHARAAAARQRGRAHGGAGRRVARRAGAHRGRRHDAVRDLPPAVPGARAPAPAARGAGAGGLKPPRTSGQPADRAAPSARCPCATSARRNTAATRSPARHPLHGVADAGHACSAERAPGPIMPPATSTGSSARRHGRRPASAPSGATASATCGSSAGGDRRRVMPPVQRPTTPGSMRFGEARSAPTPAACRSATADQRRPRSSATPASD